MVKFTVQYPYQTGENKCILQYSIIGLVLLTFVGKAKLLHFSSLCTFKASVFHFYTAFFNSSQ